MYLNEILSHIEGALHATPERRVAWKGKLRVFSIIVIMDIKDYWKIIDNVLTKDTLLEKL